MKKIILFVLVLVISRFAYSFELNNLINTPTAGILQKGEYEISAKIHKNNGLLLGAKVGLFPRFMFGVSYGAEQLVGNISPEWHKRVEFNAKLRILDESAKYPAVALGYDSQGHGNYIDEINRYDIKSKGAYLVASKNWAFFGNLGTHLGLNKNIESREDGDDKDINVFLGIDKTIGDVINLLCEYDFAWNDDEEKFIDQIDENLGCADGKGYLNASADIHFTESIILKISFLDILQNNKTNFSGSDRSLTLLYNMTF